MNKNRQLYNQSIARVLKNRRNYIGKNQEDVAILAEIPRSTYAKYESGMHEINPEALDAIAEAMETTADAIIEHANKLLDQQLELQFRAIPRADFDKINAELIKAQQKIITLQDELRSQPPTPKNPLALAITTKLTTLNDSELRLVSAFLDDMISKNLSKTRVS